MSDSLWGGPYAKEPQEIIIAALGDFIDGVEAAKDDLLESLSIAVTYEDGEEIKDELLQWIADIVIVNDRLSKGYLHHNKEINSPPKPSAKERRLRNQLEAAGMKDRS